MKNNLKIYEEAAALLRKGDEKSVKQALDIYHVQTQRDPSDPKGWFEYAGAFDFLGREAEALPFYQKALKLGVENLPYDEQPRLYVQMGSTLRNLKRFDEAKQLLTKGIEQYPKVEALKLFLALVEYSLGNNKEANKALLQKGLEKPVDDSVKHYLRALTYYFEHLDY